MRALRLPCIALAALLALALVNSLLLSRWCARWGDLLDAADACVQAEDWAGADAALENLRRDWDARQTWLHIVIEHGEIEEKGDHEQLLEQQGRYYRLYTGQFKLN